MDISEFDVILEIDWLTAYRVIINCDRRRVISYTPDDVYVMCNDPYQIIQVFFFKCLTKFDQQLVCGPKLTFSRMNNFGLTKTSFRRPRR